MPRLFTRDEAEQVLPRIVPLLEELRALKHQHDEFERKLVRLQQQMQGNGHGLDVELARARQGQAAAAIAVNGTIERVGALGAEVKDIDMGLIDFRAEKDGRVVYLCWKLGEDAIAWWHELDTGYGSRHRLD